jgi:hypothetical protein
MRFWNWLTDFLLGPIEPVHPPRDEGISINPATGLPMTTPGIGGVDVGGNPFGHDLHRWDDHHIDHGHHHDAGSIGSSYDHWSNTGASGFDPSRGY